MNKDYRNMVGFLFPWLMIIVVCIACIIGIVIDAII